MSDVVCTIRNKTGIITLNRPEKINALTHEMIEEITKTLNSWKNDEQIELVLLEGAGPKGFCAGGDMKFYYDNRDQALTIAKKFFPTEYEMDLQIIQYPKPVVAFLDGIVMGGGVGISYGADYKIVTEKTKWAMPEVNIGFFPDVGASFFLNQIPAPMARYISLLGKVLRVDDVCYLGYATHKIQRDDLDLVKEELINSNAPANPTEIEDLLVKYSEPPLDGYLKEHEQKIEQYFDYSDIDMITEALKKGADEGDAWAQETLQTLQEKSVFSQMIVLEQLEKAKEYSIEQCFDLELNLSYNFMENPDFFEGLRSVLVEKDQPDWHYKTSKDVPKELIEKYLTYRP